MSNFDSESKGFTFFIDIGNSSIKLGWRSGSDWNVEYFQDPVLLRKRMEEVSVITEIVIASVRKEVIAQLKSNFTELHLRVITTDDIPSTELDYNTPETLGIDRYLACLGAKSKTNKAVVVIDAGSACTIDYMDEFGVFKGGVIMPGLFSILGIFNNTAPELPEIAPQLPNEFPGKSTKSSLELGLTQFFADGIDSHLRRYTENFGDYELFVTGGDAEFIESLNLRAMTPSRTLIFEGMEHFGKRK